MLALVSALVGPVLNGLGSILAPIFGYFTSKANTELEGFKAAAQADKEIQIALLNAHLQLAQLKASQNQWWGARLLFLAGAGFVIFHFGAVVCDSIPLFGHLVGSWGIAALPKPMDEWEGGILMSLFLTLPGLPTWSAIQSWFHKK